MTATRWIKWGIFATLILFVWRITQTINFFELRHVVTSGYEEESLFALWKLRHGWDLYAPINRIPFAATYFNWFFYAFYDFWLNPILNVLKLQDAWLPVIGRSITLTVTLCGVLSHYLLLRHVSAQKVPIMVLWAVSIWTWLGPLLGYWTLTVRPDVLALLFDTLAVLAFVHFDQKRKFLAVILACAFCYLSWACKQINIIIPVSLGLYLLLKRDARVFLLSGMMALVWGATLLVASPTHLKMLFFFDTAIPLSWAVWQTNLMVFIKKTSPVLAFLSIACWAVAQQPGALRSCFRDRHVQLSLCIIFVWSLILMPASSKVGSAENYYFVLMLALGLLAVKLAAFIPFDHRALKQACAVMSILMVGSSVYALVRDQGHLKQQHLAYLELQQCMRTLPAPIFVMNHYAALPWMNPRSVPFVLAYNYWHDRAHHLTFEQDGIGGLIKQGYFNALVLPQVEFDSFDGASLASFQKQQQPCAGYAVYIKKSSEHG